MFESFRQMGTFRMHQLGRFVLMVALMVSLFAFSLLEGANGLDTHPSEVEALRDIKESLIDPNGALSNWNRGDPCSSSWTGVFCYNITTDGYLHVQELQLLNRNLSGNLSPALGRLSYLQILDFMWNKINGTIPKEIGSISSLQLLLLNGNRLTGTLPEELGYLSNLDRIQIDQNEISGPIPISFANLTRAKHFHMNNNSLSGPIPPELSGLPELVHLLIDNNNLSGDLPRELANMPRLKILQLDNNHFDGSTIPAEYGSMDHLLKLSIRNCGLQGPIPNLSKIPQLTYVDLSFNQLNGTIPPDKLSDNITTIDLSYNNLTGSIPANFSSLPHLQKLSLANNSLSGSVPSVIWQNRTPNGSETLIFELQNNNLSNISGSIIIPPNVTVRLRGNPILCSNANLTQFCGSRDQDVNQYRSDFSYVINLLAPGNTSSCPQSCPPFYEYAPQTVTCFCAAPLLVGFRLKSPGFSDFEAYRSLFETYLTRGLRLNHNQLDVNSTAWQAGPRLRMYLKIFPVSDKFNVSEVSRIQNMFTGWTIPDNDLFGPHELLNFTLEGPYRDVTLLSRSSGLNKGAIAGIVVGAIAASVTLSAFVSLLIFRLYTRKYQGVSRRRHSSKMFIKIDNVKEFTYQEMALATKNFHSSSEVGQGGYGKVYKGVLADGTVVAIKRAQEGSLQGEKEFLTEIELLSRLHHRNLVSLIGYCDEQGEQMLIYEFIRNGTLREHLSGKYKESLTFALRLRVALGSAKGILYLHTEANPPIFHRDIKASNILLDLKYNAKVADFGLSRLAPVPETEGSVPGHVSTVVKGTPGYLDPEYFLTHKLTDKSDVYSLGVVFLELLTGMHPISHGKNIVREVNIAYRSGMIFSVIDERMGSYPSECVEKFVTLALKCCHDEPEARPSMAEVVRVLESVWLMMPESDTRLAESLITNPQKVVTPPSSSASLTNPYSSSAVSGTDLVSGVMHSIVPR